jgi:hypothetical protein
VITKKDKEAAARLLAEIEARREYEAAAEEEQWRTDPGILAAKRAAAANVKRMRVEDERRALEEEGLLTRVECALRARGVFLDISGCGCCGSPRVRIEIEGDLLVDTENFELEMIES